MLANFLVESLVLVSIIAGVPLLAALLVGLLISIFQAATQINEQSLTFVPKLATIVLILTLSWPWTASLVEDFVERMFLQITEISQTGIS